MSMKLLTTGKSVGFGPVQGMNWTMDTNGTVAVSFSFGKNGGCKYVKILSLL